MDTIKHHEMVAALVKSGQAIVDTMNAGEAHALHMAVGISGESGELLDAIKKHVIYKKPLDLNNVIEELGDIEFYLEGLRQGLGITRELTLTNNIAKLSERYKGLKYSNEAAQARADKVSAVIPEIEKWLHEAETKEALERSFAHVEGLRQGLGITRELTNNIAKLREKWLHEAETKEALERSFAHVEGLTKAAV